jgi:hypothetical protein
MGEAVNDVRRRKGQAYAIPIMCRALHVHRNGRQASKRQAVQWALQEMREWSWLIQSALAWRKAWREDDGEHAATYADIVHFVNCVRDQIQA